MEVLVLGLKGSFEKYLEEKESSMGYLELKDLAVLVCKGMRTVRILGCFFDLEMLYWPGPGVWSLAVLMKRTQPEEKMAGCLVVDKSYY